MPNYCSVFPDSTKDMTSNDDYEIRSKGIFEDKARFDSPGVENSLM